MVETSDCGSCHAPHTGGKWCFVVSFRNIFNADDKHTIMTGQFCRHKLRCSPEPEFSTICCNFHKLVCSRSPEKSNLFRYVYRFPVLSHQTCEINPLF